MPQNDDAKSCSVSAWLTPDYPETVRNNLMPQCGTCQGGHGGVLRLPNQITTNRETALN
ncbi:MAG: hypothetical protein ACI8PB_001660 [Desulforhopalus sp.]|jgi:hypothetical protein